MNMKQVITIVIDLKEDQEPFNPIVINGYNDLEHFFTDIGYTVEKIASGVAMSQTVASHRQQLVALEPR